MLTTFFGNVDRALYVKNTVLRFIFHNCVRFRLPVLTETNVLLESQLLHKQQNTFNMLKDNVK